MATVYKTPVDHRTLRPFKLVAGDHIGPDFSRKPKELKNPDTGVLGGYTYPSRKSKAGDVVWHYKDLANDPRLVNKFQELPAGAATFTLTEEPAVVVDETPGVEVPPVFGESAAQPQAQAVKAPGMTPVSQLRRDLPSNLNSMSLAELRQFASEEEIDLRNAKSRDEVLKVIREA